MILMIDNYDSFTYNLVQYFGDLGETVRVYRNDRIAVEDIERLKPVRIVISPGPGRPSDAGVSMEIIQSFKDSCPILGVCLGHQCIGEAFGARIKRAPRIMHGKTSLIFHDGRTLFSGIEHPFEATRYHSLIVERGALPECLEISAWTDHAEIMGVRHRRFPVEGIQFHPESILTRVGRDLLKNFLKI